MVANGESAERYQLRLIGPFALLTPDGTRIPISSRKAMALIAMLAMAPHGERSRTWLRARLWGSRFEEQSMASLRRELSTIDATLSRHGAGGLIERNRQYVTLRRDMIHIDIINTPDALGEFSAALRGDFLEGLDLSDCEEFEEWLRAERARTEQLFDVQATRQERPLTIVADTGQAVPAVPPANYKMIIVERPKPSMAVLPFETVTQPERLGVTIADEIAMMLARMPQLSVMATASGIGSSGNGGDLAEIVQRLGVEYLIRGTMRHGDGDVRVNVSLIDGHSMALIWSSQFVGTIDRLSTLIDDIAMSAAAQVWTSIDSTQRIQHRQSRNDTPGHVDTFWNASDLFRAWTEDAVLDALGVCETLMHRHPEDMSIAALAAFCHGIATQYNWHSAGEVHRAQAQNLYSTAVAKAPNNVEVLGYAAGTIVMIGDDVRLAERLIDHALSLLPSYQPSLFWGGWVDLVAGNHARSRERFELSLRLNPVSGVRAYAIGGIGVNLLIEGRVEESYDLLSEAMIHAPTYPPILAAYCVASTLLGREDKALWAAQQLQGSGAQQSVLALLREPQQRAILESVLSQR